MAIPGELSKALKARRLVPFAGSGVSRAVLCKDGTRAFSDWKDLLLHMEAAVRKVDRPAAAYLKSRIKLKQYLEAAEMGRKSLGKGWVRFLQEEFRRERSAIDTASLELAQALWRLGSELVITTNYERVLQWAADAEGKKDFVDFTSTDGGHLGRIKQWPVTQPSVWHLHGSMEKPDEIVLTPDGYQRLYPASGDGVYRAGLPALRETMAAHSLLFVGFGMEQAIRQQLEWVEEVYQAAGPKHFVLVRESELKKKTAELRGLPIEPVGFTGYGPPLLEKLAELAGIVGNQPVIEVRSHGNPAKYLADLAEETAWIDLDKFKMQNSEARRFAMEKLYIEPLMPGRGMEKPVQLREAIGNQQSTLILGDAGSGKSTFLRAVAHGAPASGRFPVLVKLAELEEFQDDPRRERKSDWAQNVADPRWITYFLASQGKGLDAAFWDAQLRRGETTLLLDGLDESADRSRRRAICQLILAARREFAACRMVVTSRDGAEDGLVKLEGFATL